MTEASPTSSSAIGVYDSGVGGLTVLSAIRELLPHENLIYVADSGHLPYGQKSQDFVVERALAITEFFISNNVKAIAKGQDMHMMDIKAFIGGKILPVKMLVSDDEHIPVKAIGEDGTIYDIKAITPEGDRLDVKGIRNPGNILQLKAISKEGDLYGVKAISPSGNLMDVKGIKMVDDKVEMKVNGVDVYAHIKAIPMVMECGL